MGLLLFAEEWIDWMLLKLGFLFVMQAWTDVADPCCGSALRTDLFKKTMLEAAEALLCLILGLALPIPSHIFAAFSLWCVYHLTHR